MVIGPDTGPIQRHLAPAPVSRAKHYRHKAAVTERLLPIEQKESFRWLENLRKSTSLFAAPDRCVHVGDRESDIYELFSLARDLGMHFIVRSCVDRLAGDGQHTITNAMDEVAVQGLHQVEFRDRRGRLVTAPVELRYRRITVLPPIGKQKRYPPLSLTVLHAREPETPKDRPAIDWRLITDLLVDSPEQAVEKLDWYSRRWKIEVFHHILKTGCRAEHARLRTAERLVKLIAVYCILAWRVFWTTMIGRSAPRADPHLTVTDHEIALLDRLVPDLPAGERSLFAYVVKVARLGGYLARSRDLPPGNLVIWRGFARLADIALGAALAQTSPGCG